MPIPYPVGPVLTSNPITPSFEIPALLICPPFTKPFLLNTNSYPVSFLQVPAILE